MIDTSKLTEEQLGLARSWIWEASMVEAVKKILSEKMLMHFSADEVSATIAQVVAAVREAK